jgi:hypothetical protein
MFWIADKRCDAGGIDRRPITGWPMPARRSACGRRRRGHDTPALLKLGKAGHSAGPIGGDIFVASRGSTSVIATWCGD